MSAVELKGVVRRFLVNGRPVPALDRVDLACPAGAFLAIVGRSGCGKTTLLRTVAGFEAPDRGEILIEGGGRTAMMFQEPRLMPWLTVRDNVGFGLRDAAATAAVAPLLERLHLAEFADAYPQQLSGGMAQRAALGRALCLDPDLLLMDEPFGALDAFTRRRLQRELIALWQGDRPRTVLFVTHDVEEAVLLAERVVVMERGHIVADLAIPLPYPRVAETPEVALHRRRVVEALADAQGGVTETEDMIDA
jgi:sulfonate transport system ATP-binding protein